jgi:hypothetical protein
VADKPSFVSRFAVKFVEMLAAGVATAVSGYFVAHLSGYWASPVPQPATVLVAPMTGAVPKALSVVPVQPPAAPAAADAGTPEPAPAPPVQTTGSASSTPAVSPARKHAEPAAADNKPRDAAETKRATAESKARDRERDKDSVEAQVRAALAKVDASQPPPAPAEMPPPMSHAVAAPLMPAAPLSPLPQTTLTPAPLGSVEIRSQPVAAVDPSAPPAPAAEEDTQGKDKGLLAAIKHLPDLLRPASGAVTAEPPRPPRPVGADQ